LYTEKNDSVEDILKNLPVKKVIFPKQTHSCNIKSDKENSENCDGIYTTQKNVAIGVKTADCGAIVLTDYNKVAVVHAGWRGILGGIIENSLNIFEKEIEIAFLSPFARSCCYEVKEDFVKNLNEEKKFYLKYVNSKIYFSMEDIIKDKLKNKVKTIYDSKRCTICDNNLFSYRKGDLKERMLTIAYLEE
jgi:hypothetical protein